MTSKDQLQNKIKKLEAELQSFKEQLNNYKEITIETAVPGDTLEDGSIVLQKSNGLALLVAPASTEVECTRSKYFPEVFDKLKEQGFNPYQWFIPTKEQLELAYSLIRNHFSATYYWSSTEIDSKIAYTVHYNNNSNACRYSKTFKYFVRAFRCVTY